MLSTLVRFRNAAFIQYKMQYDCIAKWQIDVQDKEEKEEEKTEKKDKEK